MEDVDPILDPFLQKDPDGVLNFMKENHPETFPYEQEGPLVEEGEAEICRKHSTAFDRRFVYWVFRNVNMMGYGPGLRCLRAMHKQSEDSESVSMSTAALTLMRLKDDHDDWEENVGFHPAVIDCGLQSSLLRGPQATK